MTDVGNFSTPGDARAVDEETRARPRSRGIDGGDTKSPTDGVDASNREDDERNAVQIAKDSAAADGEREHHGTLHPFAFFQ